MARTAWPCVRPLADKDHIPLGTRRWIGDTVNVGGAWRAGSRQVGSRNKLASHQVALFRVSVSTEGDQPRRVVVFSPPAQLTHGRGDAGSSGIPGRQIRTRALMSRTRASG